MPSPVQNAADRRVGRSDVRIRAVIDVEQRALRALDQDRLAVGHRPGQQHRDVAHHRPQALGVRQQLRQHRLPVHRAVLHEAVARVHVVAHVLLEPLRIVEVADADAAARDLVLVRRADAARGRPDLAFAAPRLGQQVEVAVIRQDQMRLVADENTAGDVDAVLRQLVDLGKQRLRIDDDAVADDARDARVQDAGRNQAEDELGPVHVDRVTGVVSSLVAADQRKMRREKIDDLALALIAPLRAEHD